MSMDGFDLSELTQFKDKLDQLNSGQREKIIEDCTKEVTKALLNRAIHNTITGDYKDLEPPYNNKTGGTLKRGWTGGVAMSADAWVASQPVHHVGATYQMTVTNIENYASYVENGHRQRPGRFVPALGKRLKSSWVEGQHMLKRAETDANQKQRGIVSRKVSKELKRYFG